MAASAKLLAEGKPAAGESVAEKSTSISYNMTANHYYLVTTESGLDRNLPADHKAAIEGGWKRYLWNGAITWSDLKWNTTYYLYDYDLKDTKSVKKTQIQTNKGKIGGSIQLSENMAAGETLTATLKDTLTTKGTWKWEKAESPTSKTWEELTQNITTAGDNQMSSYVLQSDDSSNYIRVTFTTEDESFEGSIQTCSTSVVKAPLTAIKIYTDAKRTVEATDADMVVDKGLYALVEPKNFDTEVDYTWHHMKDDGTVNDEIQGRGNFYQLKGKDVNEKICVKATAKGEGGASGIVKSTVFSKSVVAAPTAVPTSLPVLAVDKETSIEDTSVTIKMPEEYTIGNGLYQFAYSQAGAGDVKTEFKVYARGSNPVTITGLKPRTKYYIYVKAIGENGHLPSEYTEEGLSITTKNPFVKGTLNITSTGAGYRYGDTLNVEITGEDTKQTGDYTWYLVNDDGTRGEAVTEPTWDGYSVELNNSDYINHRLEVVLSGTGNYGGEISAQSEVIQLAECKAPSGVLKDLNTITDKSVIVKLPKLTASQGSERFNIGFSKLKNGVPEEYRPSDQHVQYASEDEALIEGLDRNTTYYLFLRFDANKQHEKSDWSTKYLEIKTEKTEYNGAIYFEYGSAGSAPTQGERLIARLGKIDAAGTKPNSVDGVWSWYKTIDGVKTEIKDFYPGQDGYSTYYEIPKNEKPGTVYTVEFKFHEDYKKKLITGALIDYVDADSQALLKYEKEQMAPADGNQLKEVENSATDSTITFQMDGTPGLVYGFCYSTGTDVAKAKPADYDAYAGTNITIKGLSRYTDYNIWVKVKGNDMYSDSDWSSSYITVSTKKTDILGYVEISGSDTAGQEMEAVYNKASYMPAGSDEGGNWQWYRENDSGAYDAIAGATDSKYTPQSEDIHKSIKAVYSMPESSDFIGSKEAITPKIKKQLVTNTTITNFVQGKDTPASKPSMDFTLGDYQDIWYRIQNANIDAPQPPTEIKKEDLEAAGWTQCTALTTNTSIDYLKNDLTANTKYTLYIVKAETDLTQVSSIISSSADIGTVNQTGTMEIKNTTDVKEAEDGSISYTKIAYPVVGKTITAELKDANNVQGTWKWYKSTTTCGDDGKTSAPASDSDSWEQLASGYSPTINKSYSSLTLSEDLWKHYIKAEFVPNNEIGYGGDSIQTVNTSYIRKIYEESLSLKGKGYENEIITANVDGYIESGNINTNRDTVVFKIDGTVITNSDINGDYTYDGNQITIKLLNKENWNGKKISVEVSKPKAYYLYVTNQYQALDNKNLISEETITYKAGTAISSEEDFIKFMEGNAPFDDRSNTSNYVITKNLNLDSFPAAEVTPDKFYGVLDGDFHTISHLKNPVTSQISGSIDDAAEIKNLIISNISVENYSGVIAGDSAFKNVKASKLFMVDASIHGHAGGMIFANGEVYNQGESLTLDEIGTARGIFDMAGPGVSSGGLVGWVGGPSTNVHFNNCFMVGNEIKIGSRSAVGGLIRGSAIVKNSYSAGKYIYPSDAFAIGAIAAQPLLAGSENNYYDKVKLPATNLADAGQVIGKLPSEMVGSGLVLGDKYVYREGYYPQLKWILEDTKENSPSASIIADLYSATSGAFISVDNKTTATQMFEGKIYGVLQVPENLRRQGFSYKSDHPEVIKVTDGGTILPISPGTAIITVTYNDKTTGATPENTFEFTVSEDSAGIVKALNTVSISGTANPGSKLTAMTSGAPNITYQWYRRKNGETNRTAINGAKSDSYVIQPSDVGYEIQVDVGATGFATMSSGFTNAVTSIAPTGITIKSKTDSTVELKADGVDGANYEYAYATSEAGNKIIAGQSTEAFTITGLTRNTDYWFFARVAGGTGYEPSEWKSIDKTNTEKTDIVGPIKTNGAINMGNEVRVSIGDDNLQKGNWKIERIPENADPIDITVLAVSKNEYDISYLLTKEDVGCSLKFTFYGTGDFKDPIKEGKTDPVSYTIQKVLRKTQIAPDAPVGEMKSAHSLSVKHTGMDTYDFGYTDTIGKDIEILDNDKLGYDNNEEVTIDKLNRNTTYYLYARLHEKDDYEPSPWSAYATAATDQSDITGKSKVVLGGEQKVEEIITFTASGTDPDTTGLTGIWILERIDKDDQSKSNTVLATPDEINPNKISYQLKPEDAGYKIKATYKANGDYKGSCSFTSDVIENADQVLGTAKTEIKNIMQYQLTLNVVQTDDQTSIYEFGYRKHNEPTGVITSNNVTVTWGKDVEITSLSRNTEYDFFIRKAEKIGYNASEWQLINTQPIRTQKSPLLGNITVTSDTSKPSIDTVLTVEYVKGIYPDEADDSTSGNWQWYLDKIPVSESDGGIKPSFKIPPVDGNPVVTVRYIAKNDSDFSEYTERSFGNVYKDDYEIPVAPTVTALGEDSAQIGSLLRLISKETPYEDIYYYLQSSDIDELPVLEISEDVDKKETSKVDNSGTDNTEHWIKVNNEQMDIRVDANKSYVVYVARLESRTHAASGINSARPVKSAKEPLERTDYKEIEEADTNVSWKTLQSKTIQYTVDGKAPTVSWKYYVASKKDGTEEWQNIDAEMRAVKNSREDGISADKKYAVSRFEVPLKYTGQYLKITMTGIDDYSGMITLITKNPLEGALITGTARIETKDTTKVLDTLEAKYLGEDEKNGVFTWYRQAVDSANNLVGTAEKITDTDPGNISSYALTPSEMDCIVYAVYTAPASGQYVGSVQTNGIIVRKKAEQNKPNSPTKVRVNGNSIQFGTPMNYKTDKIVDIPYVQVGYLRYVNDQPVNDKDEVLTEEQIESNIHWQSEAEYKAQDTWFRNLRRDSDYKLFARFIPTAAYDQSVISDPSETIKTEHALFREGALVIQDVADMRQAAARPSNIGSQIKFIYSGEGYDEGEFLLHRSNGETIPVDSDRVETNLTAKTISYSYTYTKEDVGSYITVEYKAKADAAHYQGSIKKTNSVIVTKAVNPESPKEEYRGLERDLDTNLILTKVNDTYEYYLTSDKDYVPVKEDWDTVEIKENGSHEFTNLDRLKEYYLWTRIAETDTYDPSAAVKSDGLSPAPFIDFGPLTITNSKDRATPPKAESDFIAFPDTLKKGSITINENQITKKQEESDQTAAAIDADIKHPVSDFQKADGSATDLVYEKGSTWGDRNFAVELVFYDKDKKVLARADGRSTSVEVPETAGFMKVFIYRVNAMSETGYIWEAMLKDDSAEHITAKLKADITMTTQITMQLPTKIQLTLDDQVMKQSTNNEQAINKSSMPMEFGIDRKVAEKSTRVPALKGQMTKTTYYDQIPSGDAYLKCSNDGTNFTNITSGAWLDTGLPNSEPAHLMRLGADAWSGYYFSGITSKAQTWDFTENKFIDEAYKFKFIIEVAKEDAMISGKRIYEVKGKEETK
ncbi:hypothetical protein [[Clostridium] innocuum]|nr:hypothetical protein [[Clostridium] innocuum]